MFRRKCKCGCANARRAAFCKRCGEPMPFRAGTSVRGPLMVIILVGGMGTGALAVKLRQRNVVSEGGPERPGRLDHHQDASAQVAASKSPERKDSEIPTRPETRTTSTSEAESYLDRPTNQERNRADVSVIKPQPAIQHQPALIDCPHDGDTFLPTGEQLSSQKDRFVGKLVRLAVR